MISDEGCGQTTQVIILNFDRLKMRKSKAVYNWPVIDLVTKWKTIKNSYLGKVKYKLCPLNIAESFKDHKNGNGAVHSYSIPLFHPKCLQD